MMVLTLLQFAFIPVLMQGRASLAPVWRETFIVAVVLGIGVRLGGLTLWPPLMAAGKLLGDISLGLMIFSLGVRLSSTPLRAWRIGLAGALATPLTGMLVAWAYGELAGLGRADQDILFIFGALPPAVSSFIFAERYRQEPDKVAAIVMISNVAALFFMPLALRL